MTNTSKHGSRPEWRKARRIAVKIGSALLTDGASGTLKQAWLEAIAGDVAELRRQGRDVILVSSGAIALGRGALGLAKGPLRLEEAQAAASVGQIALAHAYQTVFRDLGLTAAQILVTPGDTEERRRYLNARNTVETLFKLGAIPVVNENDTVATTEIRYGDDGFRLSPPCRSRSRRGSRELEQRLDGVARVEIAPPLLGVARRHQDLRGCQPQIAKNGLVGVGEGDLPAAACASSSRSGPFASPSARPGPTLLRRRKPAIRALAPEFGHVSRLWLPARPVSACRLRHRSAAREFDLDRDPPRLPPFPPRPMLACIRHAFRNAGFAPRRAPRAPACRRRRRRRRAAAPW